MRILLILGNYLPDKSGGIENYSHLLSKILIKNDHIVEIAILKSPKTKSYVFDGTRINILNESSDEFTKLLQKNEYDICHFQEYSGKHGINIQWFKAAKKYCGKVYFTFHLPYFTCYKNDFRLFGVEDCNNFSSPDRCVKCVIGTKMHYNKKEWFNLINYGIKLMIPVIEKTNKIRNLRSNIKTNTSYLPELLTICDNIFVISNWFKILLEQNGLKSFKISYIPTIVSATANPSAWNKNVKMKLVFIGRVETQKGLLLLCKAMTKITMQAIKLDVFGNIVDEQYFKKCHKEFPFNFKGIIPRKELLSKLTDYDFLILPSVFTEMYPLVIQEAFAANLPVIASAAKGNVDMIKEEKNGFIFNYDDYQNLASIIDKAYSLKENGWQPEFETTDTHENDLKEILSYYS